MRKLICIVLILCSIASLSIADSIFGEFTYEELLALHHFLDQEIMTRPEWKEVTVPSGDWIVGVDIPEGKYSIRPVKNAYICIKDNKGDLVINKALSGSEIIGKADLKTAYTVHISGDVIFSPAVGLGF